MTMPSTIKAATGNNAHHTAKTGERKKRVTSMWSIGPQTAFTVTAVDEYDTAYEPTSVEKVPLNDAALWITSYVAPTVGIPVVFTSRLPATESTPPEMPEALPLDASTVGAKVPEVDWVKADPLDSVRPLPSPTERVPLLAKVVAPPLESSSVTPSIMTEAPLLLVKLVRR